MKLNEQERGCIIQEAYMHNGLILSLLGSKSTKSLKSHAPQGKSQFFGDVRAILDGKQMCKMIIFLARIFRPVFDLANLSCDGTYDKVNTNLIKTKIGKNRFGSTRIDSGSLE